MSYLTKIVVAILSARIVLVNVPQDSCFFATKRISPTGRRLPTK